MLLYNLCMCSYRYIDTRELITQAIHNTRQNVNINTICLYTHTEILFANYTAQNHYNTIARKCMLALVSISITFTSVQLVCSVCSTDIKCITRVSDDKLQRNATRIGAI